MIKLDKNSPDPLFVQIKNYLIDCIRSGKYKSRSSLPSIAELEKMSSAGRVTVIKALCELAKEGFVTPVNGKGYYVKDNADTPAVGIYSGGGLWDTGLGELDYCRQVYRCFQAILFENSMKEILFIDPRPSKEQGNPWDVLEKAVREREIQSLMVLNSDGQQAKWLSLMPIPMTGLGRPIPCHIGYEMAQFYELALRSLSDKKCRSVGLISHYRKDSTDYDCFQKAVKKAGMKICDEWFRGPSEPITKQERYGYEQFRKLWKQTHRPEGLMVFPDNMAKGVVTAVIQENVKVAEELHLALHRHAELNYICPFPATFIESSCHTVAQSMWEQLQRQLNKKSTKPVMLDFSAIDEKGE
ncbi:MAG: substrate-binding domain-containing protein [Victivallales bacterium]